MSDKKGGSNRDWGYASYDMDDPDSENLIYTSYEKNGKVNQYAENDDGGHSHYYWENNEDHDAGKDADSGRSESNSSSNPSTGEVQDNGGCYLTTACMKHMQENFDDSCDELMTLRWFRDKFVSKDDIKHYYVIAPIIVEALDELENNDEIYSYIYDNVVDACVKAIKKGNYKFAYDRYKSSILVLEEQFAKPKLVQRFIKTLKLRK